MKAPRAPVEQAAAEAHAALLEPDRQRADDRAGEHAETRQNETEHTETETQTETQQTEAQQTEAQQALARLQQARSRKLRRLLSVIEPQRQAEVVLRANGLEPPQALLDAVVEFEVDHSGAFALVLRQPVTVHGLTFGRFVSGRRGHQRLEQLEGVRDAEGPVSRVEATRDGGLRAGGRG